MTRATTHKQGALRILLPTLVGAMSGLVVIGIVIAYALSPLRVAERALRYGDSEQALQRASEYLLRHPGDHKASLIAARSLAELGRWSEAETYFASVPELSVPDKHLRARGLVGTGFWLQATELYEEILRATPNDPEVLRRLVQLYYQDGQMDRAVELCQSLAQHTAYTGMSYAMLGIIEQKRQRYAESVSDFRRALEHIGPNDNLPIPRERLVLELAQALIRLGSPTDAEQYLEELLAKSPDATVLVLFGRCRLGQGDISAAREAWRKALEADPNSVDALIELARVALQEEKLDDSVELLRRALAITPHRVEIEYTLGMTLLRAGQDDEGQQHLAAAQQLRQEMDRKQVAYEVVALAAPAPQRRVTLAMAALRQQNYEIAEALVQAVLNEYPDYPVAQELMRTIQERKP